MGTDFYLQYRGTLSIATLDFKGVSGEGLLAPRLVFTMESRASKPNQEVELQQLRSDVKFENQLIGTATLREVVHVYDDATQVMLDAPISRQALAYIDEHARTPEVHLALTFRGYARATQSPVGTATAAVEWSYFDLRSSEGTVRMPKSDWITRVLEPLGPPSHVLLDLPLPEPPDQARWKKSLDHLEQAERFYRDGNDAEVLGRCYTALEALTGAPKNIFAGVTDAGKREKLDSALLAFKTYLHSGRHVIDSEGVFPVDHRDSAFALSQAKLWLTYIARLLSGSK